MAGTETKVIPDIAAEIIAPQVTCHGTRREAVKKVALSERRAASNPTASCSAA